MSFDDTADMVTFRNRGTMLAASAESWQGHLEGDVHQDARSAAPGWDVYLPEEKWRMWLGENEIEPKHPARHFVKFCKSWYGPRHLPFKETPA